MDPILNEMEEQYVHRLMTWDRLRMPLGWFFMTVLVLGGLVIVLAAYLTLQRLNDENVMWVTVPGFLLGIMLILFALAGVYWIRERHRIASIVRKLYQPSQHH